MYLFFIYIQKGISPDRENDQVYAKVICSYSNVAEYVNYLNNRSSKYKYYFIRKGCYIDSDSVIATEDHDVNSVL